MVKIISCLVALAGLLVPKSMVEGMLPFFGAALILTGVPHGAGDYMLSKQLTAISGKVFSPFQYLSGYLLSMLSYVAIWVIEPLLAFGAFILLSAYHFGQSNWASTRFSSKNIEFATMLSWGLLIIGVPVLLHYEQASVIISEMSVGEFNLSNNLRATLIFLLIFTNVGIIIHLNHIHTLTTQAFRKELGNVLLLLMLFFTTPLMVGFGIYFVLWHSLDAMQHQVSLLKLSRPNYTIRDYLVQSLPLTLLSFAGLGILMFFFGETFNKGQNMGALFLFIAVITVPHAFLMEWLYRVWKAPNVPPFLLGKADGQKL
jgi:Brp/Blh family beta-carotene 15,15'-monooxygenase